MNPVGMTIVLCLSFFSEFYNMLDEAGVYCHALLFLCRNIWYTCPRIVQVGCNLFAYPEIHLEWRIGNHIVKLADCTSFIILTDMGKQRVSP